MSSVVEHKIRKYTQLLNNAGSSNMADIYKQRLSHYQGQRGGADCPEGQESTPFGCKAVTKTVTVDPVDAEVKKIQTVEKLTSDALIDEHLWRTAENSACAMQKKAYEDMRAKIQSGGRGQYGGDADLATQRAEVRKLGDNLLQNVAKLRVDNNKCGVEMRAAKSAYFDAKTALAAKVAEPAAKQALQDSLQADIKRIDAEAEAQVSSIKARIACGNEVSEGKAGSGSTDDYMQSCIKRKTGQAGGNDGTGEDDEDDDDELDNFSAWLNKW